MNNNALAWIIGIIMAIAALAVMYYETGPSTAPGQIASTAAPVAMVQTTTMPGGAVSFGYPTAYGLATTPEQLTVRSYIPACNPGFDYCIYRVDPAYASTTLESAGVRVNVRADLASQSACLTTPPDGYANMTPLTSEATSYATSAWGPLGDAGAGHYASGDFYRLWASGQCVELETRIGETQYANYPAGTIGEFTNADRIAVAAELRSIVDSVTVSGTPAIFPIASSTTAQ